MNHSKPADPAPGLKGIYSLPPAGETTCRPFGQTEDGTAVELYTLRNANGMEAAIATYGGTLVSLKAPDRNGHLADVVLGYDTLEDYRGNTSYFGALIGRYGNRIGKAKFELDGKSFQLAANDGANSLHGGLKAFDKAVWNATAGATPAGATLELRYLSKDGEEGYPGNLTVTALYTLTDENELRLEFTATTDKPTVVNLTHHPYFNLAGEGSGDVLKHILTLNADHFIPTDNGGIPTGGICPVAATPFDFRKPVAVGARIGEVSEQLEFGKGYDHTWVANKPAGALEPIAELYEPVSGRAMTVLATHPGVQFYSGNYLDNGGPGKAGKMYRCRHALCLEPQHFPDSPNKAQFPSTVLRPGQAYRQTIYYRFSVR